MASSDSPAVQPSSCPTLGRNPLAPRSKIHPQSAFLVWWLQRHLRLSSLEIKRWVGILNIQHLQPPYPQQHQAWTFQLHSYSVMVTAHVICQHASYFSSFAAISIMTTVLTLTTPSVFLLPSTLDRDSTSLLIFLVSSTDLAHLHLSYLIWTPHLWFC